MKRNEDFGLPKIDEHSARIINYIFKRFRGAVPALKYSADSVVALDSIRAEYTYALMRSEISELDVINRAIELIVDDKCKYLPSPGEFIGYCRDAIREAGRKRAQEERKRIDEMEAIDRAIEEEAKSIWISRGNKWPDIKISKYFSRMHEYEAIMRPCSEAVEEIKQDLISKRSKGRLSRSPDTTKYP